jgi:hypothetical protein
VAIVARPAGATVMPEYRAYTVGSDGHFNGFEPLVCANDDEAVEQAKRLAEKHPVELWRGATLVNRLDSQQQNTTVTHDVHDGCMIPRAAK